MKQSGELQMSAVSTDINRFIMKNCQNCGHECHCGTSCTQEHKDGDNKNILILCCNHCRCDSYIDEEKYNIES